MRILLPAALVALIVSAELIAQSPAHGAALPEPQIVWSPIADQGAIVYVPKQRWHLASLAGDGMSARLAMNEYPDLAHSFEAPDPGEASR